MKDWISLRGKIVYEPDRFVDSKTGKVGKGSANQTAARKRNNPWWVVVEAPVGLVYFYKHQIERHVLNPLGLDDGLKLNYPMWGSHITVLDGRQPVDHRYHNVWKKYDGQMVDFQYSPDVENHWKFWALPVRSNALRDIRAELGLDPNYNFHITVGRMN